MGFILVFCIDDPCFPLFSFHPGTPESHFVTRRGYLLFISFVMCDRGKGVWAGPQASGFTDDCSAHKTSFDPDPEGLCP